VHRARLVLDTIQRYYPQAVMSKAGAAGLAVNASRMLYICELGGRIQEFDPNGNSVRFWGTPGSGTSQFNVPTALAVDPALFPEIEGSTDSEMLFYLALTFGLEDDAILGLERMAGFVEDLAEQHGVEHPLQLNWRHGAGVELASGGQLTIDVTQNQNGPGASMSPSTSTR
jgi:hypothetical protein